MLRERILPFLIRRKYEVLLVALIQHLYIGIVLTDLLVYEQIVWPLNMFLLGVASIGLFEEKEKWRQRLKNILTLLVIGLPVTMVVVGRSNLLMLIISAVYVVYFVVIFTEIIRFLIRPSYINADIISAAACGYFLLIEMSVFVYSILFYLDVQAFSGVDPANPATAFMDLVYYSTITVTTIGYGDIAPISYSSRLIVSLFGMAAQFYSVVLVGILISKFTSGGGGVPESES
ncbi:MAG TPA: Ion transport 2 domain protein [Cytophagales bacterium]|nr:Ion transport 2 domain protein [Cytophagales bacterium]HAA22887.1 Ion transport 2 domain protein [Cytophagales bacterium]HAP60553.1 Ion transport 2 domain protein [Cytophagales bacterium]